MDFKDMILKKFEIDEINEREHDDEFMKKIIETTDKETTRMVHLFNDGYHQGYQEPLRKLTYQLFHAIRTSRLDRNKINKYFYSFINRWDKELSNVSMNDSVEKFQYKYFEDIKSLIDLLSNR